MNPKARRSWLNDHSSFYPRQANPSGVKAGSEVKTNYVYRAVSARSNDYLPDLLRYSRRGGPAEYGFKQKPQGLFLKK